MATDSTQSIRPTKKQRELLSYIEEFIAEHGYSPSYREIMNGLQYTSVATVSLHVGSLIRRGHLRKRDRSARSLEVVKDAGTGAVEDADKQPQEGAWLVAKVEDRFVAVEKSTEVTEEAFDDLDTLIRCLQVLDLEQPAMEYAERMARLRREGQKDGS